MSRWKLVGPLAVVALAVALLANGSGLSSGGPAGDASGTAAADAIASPEPRLTSRPGSTGMTSSPFFGPLPSLQMPYFNSAAGYWLDASGRWFGTGTMLGRDCAAFFCNLAVTVRYARARTGIEVQRGGPSNDSVIVKGRTLRQLRSSWLRSFPATTFETTLVDGHRAVIATTAGSQGRSVLVLADGRLFLITEGSLLGFGTSTRTLFGTFLAGFHLMPASCWMEPCFDGQWWADPDPVVAFDADKARGSWTQRGASWHAGPGPGDRSVADYWLGKCVDNLCQGYVAVTIGTAGTGPVISGEVEGTHWAWARCSGSTLAEVATSAMGIIGASSVERIRVDTIPARLLRTAGRELVLLVHRGRIIAITAFDGFLAHNADQVMSDFLAGVSLVP